MLLNIAFLGLTANIKIEYKEWLQELLNQEFFINPIHLYHIHYINFRRCMVRFKNRYIFADVTDQISHNNLT